MTDPVALASLTSAITVVGSDYLKGIASEAGKATWNQIKALFGWTSDPTPDELSSRAATEIAKSPAIAEELVRILQQSGSPARQLVNNIVADGGKVVVAQTIHTTTFQM
jgi:hypothetical protein